MSPSRSVVLLELITKFPWLFSTLVLLLWRRRTHLTFSWHFYILIFHRVEIRDFGKFQFQSRHFLKQRRERNNSEWTNTNLEIFLENKNARFTKKVKLKSWFTECLLFLDSQVSAQLLGSRTLNQLSIFTQHAQHVCLLELLNTLSCNNSYYWESISFLEFSCRQQLIRLWNFVVLLEKWRI